jgi:hypothetical protein
MSFIIAFLGMNCVVVISAFADDEAEIRYLLSRYQQGYQTKNLEVIRSCFEALGTVEEARYKNQFASMESISLSLENISMQILTQTPRDYDAQATCYAVITYTLKGYPTPRKDIQHYTFGLVLKEIIQGILKEWRIKSLDIKRESMTETFQPLEVEKEIPSKLPERKLIDSPRIKEDYSRGVEQRIEALRKKKPNEMTEEEFQTYLLIQQNSLIERQDSLIERQNSLIDQQNSLIEQHANRVRKWQIFDVAYRIVPIAMGVVLTIIVLAD